MRKLLLVTVLLLFTAGCFFREPRVFTDDLRSVPDLVGESVKDAQGILEEEGFLIRVQRENGPEEESLDPASCPNARVASQDPPIGEKVIKATTITLKVSACG